MTTPPAPPARRRLALATFGALGLAVVVLVLFVLPAEYGVDPTGVGAATGLLALGETAPGPAGEAPPATAPPVVLRTYESAFPLSTVQVFQQEGYLAEGDTLLLPFDVAQPNVTKVTLRLEFVDANATPDGQRTRPDTFEIELKAPTGDVSGGTLVRSEANTGGGRGSASYRVRDAPHPRELEAASEAEARLAFGRNDPPDAGHAGGWLARVSMVEAQDGEVQGAALPGVAGTAASDDGNAWKITVVVESYALDVRVKPGSERRSDVVTLDLPPGGELEYKLRMALGGRVDYAWRTDGAVVYVDFHGEKAGDAGAAFTRHKSGDFAADAGTLVAPFDGSHGWFWRNEGSGRVSITLETRGQYDVIGRV